MKINWKLRLQNKTTLITLILCILAVIYQVLEACKIVPEIEQQEVANMLLTVVDILCILGIVVDPTTEGISDSCRAMKYNRPNNDKGEGKKE
ncbi:MAG: phage holin [Lachnospiraceae bacterium]|nr:phage holin [Lachnospiraceae bacterium]